MTEHESICGSALLIDLDHDPDMTPDQKAMLLADLTRRIIAAIGRMGLHGAQYLARCADAAEHALGCATPAEQLLDNLVHHHYIRGGLTPADVASEAERFRSNYEHLQLTVARHAEMYGDPK